MENKENLRMEDLRKSYNVTKRTKKSFRLPNLLNIKLGTIRNIVIIMFIISLIFYPDRIGTYIGQWFNDLYMSITEYASLTSMEWYNILITIFAFIVFYKLIKWTTSK